MYGSDVSSNGTKRDLLQVSELNNLELKKPYANVYGYLKNCLYRIVIRPKHLANQHCNQWFVHCEYNHLDHRCSCPMDQDLLLMLHIRSMDLVH